MVGDRKQTVEKRVETLIRDFGEYVAEFADRPAFTKDGQRENHLRTMALRYKLGTTAAALDSNEFLLELRKTLSSWGIGSRGSYLVNMEQFSGELRQRRREIIALDTFSLDDPSLDVAMVGRQAWAVIGSLAIVENNARLVPCTKALHHLVPNLIVPMDREYTRTFFGWHTPEFQYQQEQVFRKALEWFAFISRAVSPRQFVGIGWHTSITKVLDNAIVAFCRIHQLAKPS